MPPTRIIFLGTSAFAVPCLQALLDDARFQVDLVVTQPDKPVGRKQTLSPSPIKALALERNMLVAQPQSINREVQLFQKVPKPDFLIVVSYGQILSEEVLAVPAIAPINVHASLLPRLRGASPIQHAILQGDTETGVSVQRMVKALDAGPVYLQQRVSIGERETAATLHDKLATVAAPALLEVLRSPPQPVPQDETQVTFCGKLQRKDSLVDPTSMSAQDIDTRVRALVPWPGVTWGDCKILETSLTAHAQAMELQCKDDTTVYLLTVQPAGGKPMSGKDFERGYQKTKN